MGARSGVGPAHAWLRVLGWGNGHVSLSSCKLQLQVPWRESRHGDRGAAVTRVLGAQVYLYPWPRARAPPPWGWHSLPTGMAWLCSQRGPRSHCPALSLHIPSTPATWTSVSPRKRRSHQGACAGAQRGPVPTTHIPVPIPLRQVQGPLYGESEWERNAAWWGPSGRVPGGA